MTHVHVVDWDGTLYHPHMDREDLACAILEQCLSRGPTYVVTNSMRGWVDECVDTRGWCRMRTLLDTVVPVVSARDLHERAVSDAFPGGCMKTSCMQWKLRAFRDILRTHEGRLETFVSVGDSESERCATLELRRTCEGRLAGVLPTPLFLTFVAPSDHPHQDRVMGFLRNVCDPRFMYVERSIDVYVVAQCSILHWGPYMRCVPAQSYRGGTAARRCVAVCTCRPRTGAVRAPDPD